MNLGKDTREQPNASKDFGMQLGGWEHDTSKSKEFITADEYGKQILFVGIHAIDKLHVGENFLEKVLIIASFTDLSTLFLLRLFNDSQALNKMVIKTSWIVFAKGKRHYGTQRQSY